MKQVTLGHEDIVQDRPQSADDKYQRTLGNDNKFMAYISSCEHLDDALEQSHKFHRRIANQLISRGVRHNPRGEWARRTIVLCHLAKGRRNEVENMFVRVYGRSALDLELKRLKHLYPRAISGESL